MCGIAGFYTPCANHVTRDHNLKIMLDAIRHRGPDDSGEYFSDSFAMGMRRLSIIDLASGHQPICNEDETLWIVFNGEIYNYQNLRADLISKGHVFKTGSDTEVIVHLYEEKGKECVKYLRGMFAFAIWDCKRRELLLARDRLGIKPLYYRHAEGSFHFASEIKSINAIHDGTNSVDYTAMDYYFTLGYIPSPRTIYSQIRKLPPGHILVLGSKGAMTEKYWDIDAVPECNEYRSESDYAEEFLKRFRDAIRLHLISDVPVGAFLSAGIDSSLVVALMAESVPRVKTFTMGFGGNKGDFCDERANARIIADYYGTDHTELETNPNLEDILDTLTNCFDEPFADDSIIPSYYLCREASKHVKVALTGLGGDELFCGYERYLGLKLDRVNDYLPAVIKKKLIIPLVSSLQELVSGDYRINHLKRFVRNSCLPKSNRYVGYLSILNDDQKSRFYGEKLRSLIDSGVVGRELQAIYDARNHGDELDRATYTDIKTYLPEDILALSDRLSMHNSLELRVPYVDHEIIEFCARIPSEYKIKRFTKKYLLKKVAKSYLPAKILGLKKQGFAAPMTSWLKQDLGHLIDERLNTLNLRKHGLFNEDFIRDKIQEHRSGKEIHDKLIFSLLMFQTWYENNMGSSPSDPLITHVAKPSISTP